MATVSYSLTGAWAVPNRFAASTAQDIRLSNTGGHELRWSRTPDDTAPGQLPRGAHVLNPGEQVTLHMNAGQRLWLAGEPGSTALVEDSLVPAGRVIATRAALVALVGAGQARPAGETMLVGGVSYRWEPGATDIPDLPGLTFGGPTVSPLHFGAVPMSSDPARDCGPEIQAALDAMKASWNAAQGSYDLALDFGWLTFRSEGSLNLTDTKRPGMSVINGELYSAAAGKVALDVSGSRQVSFHNFKIIGDDVTPPAVGILLSRITDNAASLADLPAAPDMSFIGECGSRGHFSKAALVNISSEVSNLGARSYWKNKHRGTSAVAMAWIDTQEASVDLWGEEITSDFTGLPTAAEGRNSFICHDWGQIHAERAADYNLAVTAITQTNPVSVNVQAGGLTAKSIQNGDEVFLSKGDMAGVANRAFRVANVDTAADSFTLQDPDTLSDIDGTGFGAYSGGATLQNRTGPALYVAGAKTVRARAGYLLSYGSPNMVINCRNGSVIRDWVINFQSERQARGLIEIWIPAGETAVLPGIHITTPQHAQDAADQVIEIRGGGKARFDDGSLTVTGMGVPPARGLLHPAGQFKLNGFHIAAPDAAALPDPALLDGCTGTMLAQDRDPKLTLHGIGLRDVGGDVDLSDGNLTVGRMVADTNAGGLAAQGLRFSADSVFVRPETVGNERALLVNDRASTGNLSNDTHRVNTADKYTGKMVWNTSTNRPVWASGGTATAPWTHADGTTAHTPV